MLDAFYNQFTSSFGLSPINTALLLVIFFLAKQRIEALTDDLSFAKKRIERAERSLLAAQIELLELEE